MLYRKCFYFFFQIESSPVASESRSERRNVHTGSSSCGAKDSPSNTTFSSSPSLSTLLKSVLDKEGATEYKEKGRPSGPRDRSPTITTITVLESNGSVSMCDRKRKERHESTTQEHENKVIK